MKDFSLFHPPPPFFLLLYKANGVIIQGILLREKNFFYDSVKETSLIYCICFLIVFLLYMISYFLLDIVHCKFVQYN